MQLDVSIWRCCQSFGEYVRDRDALCDREDQRSGSVRGYDARTKQRDLSLHCENRQHRKIRVGRPGNRGGRIIGPGGSQRMPMVYPRSRETVNGIYTSTSFIYAVDSFPLHISHNSHRPDHASGLNRSREASTRIRMPSPSIVREIVSSPAV